MALTLETYEKIAAEVIAAHTARESCTNLCNYMENVDHLAALVQLPDEAALLRHLIEKALEEEEQQNAEPDRRLDNDDKFMARRLLEGCTDTRLCRITRSSKQELINKCLKLIKTGWWDSLLDVQHFQVRSKYFGEALRISPYNKPRRYRVDHSSAKMPPNTVGVFVERLSRKAFENASYEQKVLLRNEYRGKNLASVYPLDQRCYVDDLLQMLNTETLNA